MQNNCKKPIGSLWLILLLLFLLISPTAAGEDAISVKFEDTAYRDIFQSLGDLVGISVLIDESVYGSGSIEISNRSWQEALELVAEVSGYGYRLNQDSLLVAAKDKLQEYEQMEMRYITLSFVEPETIISPLAMVLGEDNIYVQDSGLIILTGSKGRLDQAQTLVDKLDVPQKITMQSERTLLAILQQLTERLGYDLIADPDLISETLVVDAWQMDPQEVLNLLPKLTDITIEVVDNTLIAKFVDEVEADQLHIKIYRLNYVEPDTAASVVQFILPSEQIQMDDASKSVMIRATEDQIARVDKLIKDFDQPPKQVLLEVWIQEMSLDAISAFGLEWSSDFSGFKFRESSDPDGSGYVELSWEPWEIAFALKALEDEDKAKILASPKIATLSGEEASIFVGDRVPIVLTDDEGNEHIEFLSSGIDLSVQPRISDDDFITIRVKPEVSLFTFVEGNPYPQVRTREAETIVRVKDGQPVLIGGLLQEQEVESIKKIPFLSDLPILGKLFTRTNVSSERTEMNIFLIPRIVDGSEGLVSGSFFPETQ